MIRVCEICHAVYDVVHHTYLGLCPDCAITEEKSQELERGIDVDQGAGNWKEAYKKDLYEDLEEELEL